LVQTNLFPVVNLTPLSSNIPNIPLQAFVATEFSNNLLRQTTGSRCLSELDAAVCRRLYWV